MKINGIAKCAAIFSEYFGPSLVVMHATSHEKQKEPTYFPSSF